MSNTGTMIYRLTVAIVLLSIATFVLAQGTTQKVLSTEKQEYYKIEIDCYDSSVSNAGSADSVAVKFISQNGSTLGETNISGGTLQSSIFGLSVGTESPQCNAFDDAWYRSNVYSNSISPLKTVEISISGNDGLWMDEVRLVKYTAVQTKTEVCSSNGLVCKTDTDVETTDQLVAHWGKDGGLGYCLSTDASDGDANSAWSNVVDQNAKCAETFEFDVPTQQVYVGTPSGGNYRTITFFNQAGYASSMTVMYFVDTDIEGTIVPLPKVVTSGDITAGVKHNFEIPSNLSAGMDINIFMTGVATLDNDFYATTLSPSFRGDECYKAWGTIFDPEGGSCN